MSSKKKSSQPEATFPLKSPRGTQDILPQDQKYWEYVTENARTFFRGWHFQEIQTPLFEEMSLFTRGIGDDTDIVQKELFEVKSKGKGAHYALRPEGTASMIRAYIEHGMRSWPRPIKIFMMGSFFRYERPQAGRLREFHQIDLESIGSSSPITDVQMIYMLHLYFQQLNLEDYVVLINTLGEPAERKTYIALLKEHYRRNRQKLCRDCKERLVSNPLRLLDCKEEKCQQVGSTAPRLIDHLSEASKKHFEFILESLRELGVPHEVAPSLVRGLDYYTHTVFEFVPRSTRGESQQNTFAGGGRYNGLIKQLGGKDSPAVGAAIGVERVIERVKEEGIELTVIDQPQLFIAQLGEQAKLLGLRIMKELRDADIPFAESIDRDGMQSQLRMADRLKVTWSIIIGQKEVLDGTVILRNMESGMQEVIDHDKLVVELEKRLNIVRE
jgi:histidyl-tRNA synthetase